MGRSYGQRRGRMESLKDGGDLIAYALGSHDVRFAHADYEIVTDIVNRHLDDAERRLRERG